MTSQLQQSVEYVQFFASLGAGAAVTWVVWELTERPRTYNQNNASLELVANSTDWFGAVIDNLPVIFLFIAALGSIAWTVYKTNFA